MRKKFDGFEWEKLDDKTWRAKVIKGWLILHENKNHESMVYVIDLDHEWIIVQPIKKEQNDEREQLY